MTQRFLVKRQVRSLLGTRLGSFVSAYFLQSLYIQAIVAG